MGQFKPMPKMKTTEPSVELKLKKGGAVAKKGIMPVSASARGAPMAARRGMAPAMPSRGIGMGGIPTSMETGAMPMPMGRKHGGGMHMMPDGKMMKNSAMKKGGEVESPKMHKAEMSAIKGIKGDIKSHAAKPASKAHKGLKTGGVIEKYATGGVIQKYKTGGKMKKAYGGSC
jgi:hypothetical protein